MKRNNIVSLLMDLVPRRNKEGYNSAAANKGAFIVLELDDIGDAYAFLRNHAVFGNIPSRYVDDFIDTLIAADVIHSHQEPGFFGGHTLTHLFKFRINKEDNGRYVTPISRLINHAKTWLIMVDGELDPNVSAKASSSRSISQDDLLEAALTTLPTLELGLPPDTSYDQYDHNLHKLKIAS